MPDVAARLIARPTDPNPFTSPDTAPPCKQFTKTTRRKHRPAPPTPSSTRRPASSTAGRTRRPGPACCGFVPRTGRGRPAPSRRSTTRASRLPPGAGRCSCAAGPGSPANAGGARTCWTWPPARSRTRSRPAGTPATSACIQRGAPSARSTQPASRRWAFTIPTSAGWSRASPPAPAGAWPGRTPLAGTAN